MPINVQSVLSQNITLLYDSLDLGPTQLDRNRLRAIAGLNAAVMDTDEMIVVLQPQNNTIVQIGDRRIRATLQAPSPFGAVAVWQIAHDLNSLVVHHNLIAYGFNYEVVLALEQPSVEWMNSRFYMDRNSLQQKLGGTLSAILPRFQYECDGVLNDLRIEPREGNLLFTHLNAHHESTSLPSQERLEGQFRDEYNSFLDTMNRLSEN